MMTTRQDDGTADPRTFNSLQEEVVFMRESNRKLREQVKQEKMMKEQLVISSIMKKDLDNGVHFDDLPVRQFCARCPKPIIKAIYPCYSCNDYHCSEACANSHTLRHCHFTLHELFESSENLEIH
jgi:hypothetical protein